MPTINKNFIIYDHRDFLAGQHPQSGIGNPSLLNGYSVATAFNPLRFLGNACPGEQAADVTNVSVVTSIIKSIELSQESTEGYGVGGALVHEIAPSTGSLTNAGSYPHTITGTGVEAEDIINYQISGVDYMFYSWNDNTDGDVGRLITNGDTFDDDFMSTVPTGKAVLDKDETHPMVIGDDDNLYIGNGNILAKYDGPNNTYTASRLVLPNLYKIRSFAKLNNNTLVIYASPQGTSNRRAGVTKAYFWDYVKDDPYKAYNIDGAGSGGGFEYKGSVGVWTSGLSGDPGSNLRSVRLNIFDGTDFVEVASLVANNCPAHGGVEVIGDVIYGNANGDVYSFGSPFKGVKTGLIEIANGGGSVADGALKTLFSGRQLVSSGTTTTGGLEILGTGYAVSDFFSTFANPFFDMNFKGKIKRIRTEFLKSATGGRELTLTVVNQENSTIATVYDNLQTISANKTIQEKTISTNGKPFGFFDTLQLRLDWNSGDGSTDAPIIRRVIIEFEEVRNL